MNYDNSRHTCRYPKGTVQNFRSTKIQGKEVLTQNSKQLFSHQVENSNFLNETTSSSQSEKSLIRKLWKTSCP